LELQPADEIAIGQIEDFSIGSDYAIGFRRVDFFPRIQLPNHIWFASVCVKPNEGPETARLEFPLHTVEVSIRLSIPHSEEMNLLAR
jgi:hypothetical protein